MARARTIDLKVSNSSLWINGGETTGASVVSANVGGLGRSQVEDVRKVACFHSKTLECAVHVY